MNKNDGKNKKAVKSRWKNFMKKTEKQPESHEAEEWVNEVFQSTFHTPQFSSADLIINSDVFHGVQDKDILEIIPNDNSAQPFVVQVTSTSMTNKANITLSISTQLASVLNINHLRNLDVNVRRPDLAKYELQAVLVSIKDQSLGRGEMWKLSQAFRDSAVYKSQRLSKNGVRTEISDLIVERKSGLSGVITKDTKITYRSKSAKTIWLIELSKEMWEHSPSGLLYWEKVISLLMTAFERQILKKTSHEITVIFYCRVFIPISCDEAWSIGYQVDTKKRPYIDVYKEILKTSDIRNSFKDVMKIIKREIMFFPSLINWKTDSGITGDAFLQLFPLEKFNENSEIFQGFHQSLIYNVSQSLASLTHYSTSLASSKNTNFLEAINFTLNRLQTQENEKKSSYTGAELIVISAGNSVYYTNKKLIKLTKVRVLAFGATLEVMCLRRKPMHPTPMLIYDAQPTVSSIDDDFDEVIMRSEENNIKNYTCPYWFRTHWFYSFVQLEGTCNLQSSVHTITHERPHKFHPLFRLSTIHVTLNKSLFLIKSSGNENLAIGSFDELASPRSRRTNDKLTMPKINNSSNSLLGELNKRKMSEGSGDSMSLSPRRGSVESGRRDSMHDWSRNSERDPKMGSEHTHMSSHIYKKRFSSFKRRWGQAFPVVTEFPESILDGDSSLYNKDALEYYESLWNAILEPLLLPLTTDFWPRTEDLGSSQPYQSFVSSELSRDQAVNEIIAHRLDLGFQTVQKHALDAFGNKVSAPDYAVSLGAAYHQIIPSTFDDCSLEFRTFSPKEHFLSYSYSAAIFDHIQGLFTYSPVEFSFNFNKNWDKSDSSILGHEPRIDMRF
ncbi:unnamed protein product [Blepharisma stoltei]|uniref:Uncharacterized protein n=1 Tax=Blepharisma stoltei TaxID=1481888 RepID=A0AAU9JHL3_9CILI|nr:unnamed protein product [Blepharisma stoltei]